MPGTARRLTRMAAIAFLLFLTLRGITRKVHGQEAMEELPPTPFVTTPDSPSDPAWDRLTRIEQKLRSLKARNERLQENYDELTRQYEEMVQQGADPVFGASRGNSDGRGVPGAIRFHPASFFQPKSGSSGKTSRPQSGEGGAGEKESGEGESDEEASGQRRTGEPERDAEQQEETARPGEREPRTLERQERTKRRQSGLGGAGQRIERQPGNKTDAYVERRGPYKPDMQPPRMPVEVYFGEGLDIRSSDEFFSLEFHNLSQLDLRVFDQTGDALHDNFVIPRQRWYFQGQITPYAYYYTVINRGYGTINILDTFADFNFDPKYKQQFQIRAGRMKTPFTYEYIKISESDLIAPERSLFITNFAGNRQIGAMMHGQVLDRRLEYFVGVFNGQRRSFQDYNNGKDVYGFINLKPFLRGGPEWLEQLNIAGSIEGGMERNPTQPTNLETANDQSSINSPSVVNVSPTFLIFNDRTFENGSRMQWATDVAYYYKSFTMLANYEGGFQDYSLQGAGTLPSAMAYEPFSKSAFVGVGSPHRGRVPLTGWSVACTYFVTGEQITRRVYLTEPVRPFGWYNGRLNPGAIELYSRFANLQLGDQVFKDGFANPAYWANRVSSIDTGVNWYWNHYVRLYFDWQHSMYNQPVFLSDSKSTKHEDLFWFRTQIFF
jgi:phosphate-selective porin OprO/OprP